jgi:hypothetical protein
VQQQLLLPGPLQPLQKSWNTPTSLADVGGQRSGVQGVHA